MNFLSGYRTYLVSGLAVADGVVQLIQGHKWSQIIPYLLAGAFGAAIRAAVAKVETKLPASLDTEINKVIPPK